MFFDQENLSNLLLFLTIKVYLIVTFKIQEKFKSEFLAVENNTALDFSSHLVDFYNNKSKFDIQNFPLSSSLNCFSCQALVNNQVRSQISRVMNIKIKKAYHILRKSSSNWQGVWC